MKRQILRGLAALIALLIFSKIAAQNVAELDNYIKKAVADWQTPGLSIAIVKDGKIILSKGYGVRELGKPDAVNSQTIFTNASTTKAMTALALAILVDEGKLKWSDKVTQHLPEFKVNDPFITAELTVKDLLTHNGGMPNADFLWYQTDYSTAEILRKFALVKPSYSLRGGFIYQNVMYAAAGEIVARVSGQSWASFLKTRIFDPLSMSRTFPTLAASAAETNAATPHDLVEKRLVPIENCAADGIGAAGSVRSCADDMAKYLQFWLDSARINGKRLIKPETLTELWRPQTLVPLASFYPTAMLTKPNFMTYALGWFQHDYRGHLVNFHTGSLDGTVAICGLIPSERIGVFVYANRDHTELRHALMYYVFDFFLKNKGEQQRDWSTDFKQMYDGLKVRADSTRDARDKTRVVGTTPSVKLENYVGKYSDPLNGDALVTLENGKLHVKFTEKLTATLEHWHFDTFKASYSKGWIQPDFYTFQLDENGKIARLTAGATTWTKR